MRPPSPRRIDELAQVLRHVQSPAADFDLLIGLETPDDGAVYRISDTVALVQTVDFFTPIVDDPAAWGRIAAANALERAVAWFRARGYAPAR